jgi:GNAT superfamily N-acetyltransferase
MEIRHPSGIEVVDLTSRISHAFGYSKDDAGVQRDFPQLYQASNFKHLWIATPGTGVAAHSGFYPAVMKVEGLPLPVAGIGGVFTDDAFQGQGLATSLINKCCEEAQKEGAALAFLWSDKHEFYQKQGFHLVGRQWTIFFEPKRAPLLRALGEKAEIPARALRISDEVSDELLRQSRELLGIYPLGIERSAEEHALYLGGGACRVVSAWAGSKLAAYFVIGKGKDLQGYVHEWAGAEGALCHLMAQCLEDFDQPLSLLSPQFMPDEVPWIYSLEAAGISASAEYLALVKLLSFERVEKLVREYLCALKIPSDDLVFEKEQEEFRVSWRGKPAITLDEAGLLRLLFGPQLPDDKDLHALFPMRLWYWGMDSV